MRDEPGKTPIWRAIADALRSDLSEGRYAPGDKLPTEAALAERFGVNRHTVRHGLSALIDALTPAARAAATLTDFDESTEPTLRVMAKSPAAAFDLVLALQDGTPCIHADPAWVDESVVAPVTPRVPPTVVLLVMLTSALLSMLRA